MESRGRGAARVEVCRRWRGLDDPRAIERLRSLLHDREAEVRDAAFTALAQIHAADPLLGAESGLGALPSRTFAAAAFATSDRRDSQERHPKARRVLPSPNWLACLNDSFESVRNEAFKATLNLQLAGGGAGTLRFVGRSIHAAVRLPRF